MQNRNSKADNGTSASIEQNPMLSDAILIGEFMGKFDFAKAYCRSHELPEYKPEDDLAEIGSFKYHSSWDWLMPVVNKISQSGWQFQLNSYKLSNDARFITPECIIQNIAWSTPLLATYNLVVDFIKWQNKEAVS